MATERLRERVLTIAAHVLEASIDDLEIGNDRVYIKGLPDSGLYLEILASFAAYRTHQLPPGFEPTPGGHRHLRHARPSVRVPTDRAT